MGLDAFQNEPFLDFTQEAERQRMQKAKEAVAAQLGRRYPLIIGGEEVSTPRYFVSANPAQPRQVVGEVAQASIADVDKAVAAAQAAFVPWSRIPVWDRSALLLRAGHVLRQRRRELLAWIAYEVGKSFTQGDGEVAEAIDHFEWNARLIQEWMNGKPIQPLASEFNQYRYLPLGVGVVISPWNFPTTLPLGMILSAIAAGNTVVFKPAEEATVIAHQLVRALTDAGLPAGVVNLVSGSGSELGPRLVTHPDVRFVAFVGSRAVGTSIYHEASGVSPGQLGLRRVMTEMGGKNATIVADDADLNWALDEVALSAFGYQGQKCSATSRVIIMKEVYEEFLAGLEQRARQWSDAAGLPIDNALFGPVITADARTRISAILKHAPTWGRIRVGGHAMERPGHFVEATVVQDVNPLSPLFQEEIFGPVLSAVSATSFDEALQLANASDYALTGAVFSRSPTRLAQARDEFYVGNLYLNRSSTGAMAGVHPFGGYRFSGTGPKVGGPDYLGFFLQAQTITEKVRF
jgi:1-pyrroline-5-carboxylate dehydrogenase